MREWKDWKKRRYGAAGHQIVQQRVVRTRIGRESRVSASDLLILIPSSKVELREAL